MTNKRVDSNEMGTSACSVIQGWVEGRKVGAGLMEDTHGDNACSYRDTETRGQQATKLKCFCAQQRSFTLLNTLEHYISNEFHYLF